VDATSQIQLPEEERVHERSKKAIAHRVGCALQAVMGEITDRCTT
jgi:hypothetical protein